MSPSVGYNYTMVIEGCLFDLYDTLVCFDERAYRDKSRRVADLCGVGIEAYLTAWRSLVAKSNLGLLPLTEDRVASLLSLLGVDYNEALVEKVAREEHEFLRRESLLYSDTISALSVLRARRVKLGIVTNASPSVWEVVRSKRMEPLVDCIVVSSSLGIRKPDPEIYLEALRRLSVAPQHGVFVGDGNDRELDGAKDVGLTTIRVDRPGFRPVQNQQSTPESVDFTVRTLTELPGILETLSGLAESSP